MSQATSSSGEDDTPLMLRLVSPKKSKKTKKVEHAKAGKSVKIDHGIARTAILSWFTSENRPIAPQGLVDALASKYKKALVLSTLDELVVEGAINAKDLKKTRIYFPRLEADNNTTSLPGLQSHNADLQSKVIEAELSLRHFKSQLLQVDSLQSVTTLAEESAVVSERLVCLRSRATRRCDDVSPGAMSAATTKLKEYRCAWQRRKRLVSNIIERLSVSRESDFMNELGLESDKSQPLTFNLPL